MRMWGQSWHLWYTEIHSHIQISTIPTQLADNLLSCSVTVKTGSYWLTVTSVKLYTSDSPPALWLVGWWEISHLSPHHWTVLQLCLIGADQVFVMEQSGDCDEMFCVREVLARLSPCPVIRSIGSSLFLQPTSIIQSASSCPTLNVL